MMTHRASLLAAAPALNQAGHGKTWLKDRTIFRAQREPQAQ